MLLNTVYVFEILKILYIRRNCHSIVQQHDSPQSWSHHGRAHHAILEIGPNQCLLVDLPESEEDQQKARNFIHEYTNDEVAFLYHVIASKFVVFFVIALNVITRTNLTRPAESHCNTKNQLEQAKKNEDYEENTCQRVVWLLNPIDNVPSYLPDRRKDVKIQEKICDQTDEESFLILISHIHC